AAKTFAGGVGLGVAIGIGAGDRVEARMEVVDMEDVEGKVSLLRGGRAGKPRGQRQRGCACQQMFHVPCSLCPETYLASIPRLCDGPVTAPPPLRVERKVKHVWRGVESAKFDRVVNL